MNRNYFLASFLSSCIFTNVLGHHKIYSPEVEEGRQSIEWRGHHNIDDRNEFNKSHHHVFETEYSWTGFWQSELEFHVSDKSDTPLDWEKTEFQNQIQVFDYENFAGALYFSYNFVTEGDSADEIEYKYLNEFKNNYLSFITNIIFEKEVGGLAKGSTKFDISNRIMLNDPFGKGFNIGVVGFSEFGYLTKFDTYTNQEHLYGFELDKEFEFEGFEYELSIGYLHGLTNASSDHVLLWNMEIEFN